MATPNRNQHWVPQFYLRYFATPQTRDTKKPQIWAFPIKEGEEFLTNPRNVAAQRDLYACCEPAVDERLTDLESLLGRFWPRFAEEHCALGDSFRKAVSLFIATLYLRHPRELDSHRSWRDMWAEAAKDAPKDEHGRSNIGSVLYNDEAYELRPGELDQWGSMSEGELAKEWGNLILDLTGEVARYLLTRPWAMLYSDVPAFITTDCPVAVSHRDHHRPALMAPGAIIHFPMSPTRLLVIGEERFKDGAINQVMNKGISTFNFLIFRSAWRHVFSPWDPINVCAQVCEVADAVRAEEAKKVRRARYMRTLGRIGRNEDCPCGSGRKYKKCCGL